MKKLFIIYTFSMFLVWGVSSAKANAHFTRASHIEIVSHNPIVEVVAYPNPFKEFVNLEISATNCKPTSLKIFDIIGVEKYSIDLEDFGGNGHYKVQIKDLAEGIYFCNIYSSNKLIDSKKIVCSK